MAEVDVELGNIQDSVQILLDCTHNLTNRSSSASIHILPSRVRDLNPSAFTPRVVSIGPLHRKDQSLLAFEGTKPIFLRHLLLHSRLPPEQTLKTCVQKVNASIHRIRAFYEGIDDTCYSDDELTRMMVMDGCFILEYIYTCGMGLCNENMVCGMGLCFENMVLPPAITYDLLLIENQIPFFVLQDIFECTCNRFMPAAFLYELIFVLIQAVSIFESTLTTKTDTSDHDHILGLLHEYYQASHPSHPGYSCLPFHSTAELDRAGVNFEPHDGDTQWPMAMILESPSTFVCWCWRWPWAKPTLKMPKVTISVDTELILRNLIAYEQFNPQVRHYISSYAEVMDMLINTQEDVAILVESKVLVNYMGSNEEAAKMINHVCDGAYALDFFYTKEWQQLDTYYNGYWPRNIAWLRRTYFSNPWNMIALLAGILLFLLTLVQTYFTINPI